MTFGLIIKMVEGLVNLSGTNQNLINFDDAINLISSLKISDDLPRLNPPSPCSLVSGTFSDL